MNIYELLKKLKDYKQEITNEENKFYDKIKHGDWDGAWRNYIVLLEKTGRSLKICNAFLPELKKNLEERGARDLRDVNKIISGDTLDKIEAIFEYSGVKPKKIIPKMMIIPKQGSIN